MQVCIYKTNTQSANNNEEGYRKEFIRLVKAAASLKEKETAKEVKMIKKLSSFLRKADNSRYPCVLCAVLVPFVIHLGHKYYHETRRTRRMVVVRNNSRQLLRQAIVNRLSYFYYKSNKKDL